MTYIWWCCCTFCATVLVISFYAHSTVSHVYMFPRLDMNKIFKAGKVYDAIRRVTIRFRNGINSKIENAIAATAFRWWLKLQKITELRNCSFSDIVACWWFSKRNMALKYWNKGLFYKKQLIDWSINLYINLYIYLLFSLQYFTIIL